MAQDHEFESFMSDPNGLDDRVFAPGGWAGTQDASIPPPEAMGLDLEYIQWERYIDFSGTTQEPSPSHSPFMTEAVLQDQQPCPPPRRTTTLNPAAAPYIPSPQQTSRHYGTPGHFFQASPSAQYPGMHGAAQPFDPHIARNFVEPPRRPPQIPAPPVLIPEGPQPVQIQQVFSRDRMSLSHLDSERGRRRGRVPRLDTNCVPISQDRTFLSPLDTTAANSPWTTDTSHDSWHASNNTVSPSSISNFSNPLSRDRSRGRSASSTRSRNSCSSCGRGFNTGADLRHHERNHVSHEDKPFECEMCEKKFIWNKDLKRHFRSKQHRKRLAQTPLFMACPFQGCDKVGQNGFARQDHLDRHMATVHRDRSHTPSGR
ncbi:hypothetical protein MBLNU230_g3214t1 [Neophaeotheca triangularis]